MGVLIKVLHVMDNDSLLNQVFYNTFSLIYSFFASTFIYILYTHLYHEQIQLIFNVTSISNNPFIHPVHEVIVRRQQSNFN